MTHATLFGPSSTATSNVWLKSQRGWPCWAELNLPTQSELGLENGPAEAYHRRFEDRRVSSVSSRVLHRWSGSFFHLIFAFTT